MEGLTQLTQIAETFVNYYYSIFATDRKQLSTLYKENSILTFEGATFTGVNSIIEKLSSLPFNKVVHRVATMDVQPSIANGIVVVVTGELLVDDEQNPQRFTQVFYLVPENNTYWVYHDVFRLNYG